jgi:hypothetical protein
MALARCERHGNPKGQRGNVYLPTPLLPAGYPDSGVVCGSTGCDKPAKLWVVKRDMDEYQSGQRVFGFGRPHINFAKVRVQDFQTKKTA